MIPRQWERCWDNLPEETRYYKVCVSHCSLPDPATVEGKRRFQKCLKPAGHLCPGGHLQSPRSSERTRKSSQRSRRGKQSEPGTDAVLQSKTLRLQLPKPVFQKKTERPGCCRKDQDRTSMKKGHAFQYVYFTPTKSCLVFRFVCVFVFKTKQGRFLVPLFLTFKNCKKSRPSQGGKEKV